METSSDRRKITGEWVKALRKELGLSQTELAERIFASRSAVARWEADGFRPTKMAAKALMDLANATPGFQAPGVQIDGSAVIEPHDHHESHSQRREGEHEPSKPGKPPAQP